MISLFLKNTWEVPTSGWCHAGRPGTRLQCIRRPAISVEHFYASSGLWLTLAGLQSMRLSLQKGGWRETIVGNLCDVQIRMDEVMAHHLVPFM